MTSGNPVIYSDDTDASWTYTITSRDSTVVDWVSPLVAIGTAGYVVAATFLGSAATTRQIRVPLTGLSVGSYTLYLKVPNGTDIRLGRITVAARS
jgi:hypothetical protein